MPAVTGALIAARRYLWPLRTVDYQQWGTDSPTGHRPDCSGFASMCMDLPTPGENTVTLVTENHVRPISWSELRPGDLVGKMGPGTEGDAGHVMVVTGIAAQYYTVWEQRGGGPGPTTRTIRIGEPADYKPYRSNYLLTTIGGTMHTVRSGAGDGSIYVCLDYVTVNGKLACRPATPDELVGMVRFPARQLPTGMTVAACPDYDVVSLVPLGTPQAPIDPAKFATEVAKLLPKAPTVDQIANELRDRLQA